MNSWPKDTLNQRIIESIPNPIFYKNAHGVYIGCNEAFCRFLRKSRAEIIGASVYDISPKDLAEKYEKADRDLFVNEGTQIYESQVKSGDGKVHDVIFNKSVFYHEDGKVAGIVGVIVDLTEVHQVVKKSEETKKNLYESRFKELNQLIWEISHDIRSPLTALKVAFANLGGNQSQRDLLAMTINRIEKMISTLKEKRQGFNIEEQTSKANVLPVVGILEECAREKSLEYRGHRVDFKYDIQNELRAANPLICIEPESFKRICSNLINNAVESIQGEKGVVRFEASLTENDRVLLSIGDNGQGIPPHILPFIGKMGESFNKKGGSGLGVYTSKREISRWGGQFFLESRVGSGTVVKFSLPRVS